MSTIVTTSVPGLTLIENFLDEEMERELVVQVDGKDWNTTLKRRTQHFGYEYNYTSRGIARTTTPMSGLILQVAEHLRDSNIMEMPAQCIVNEYTRDNSIAAHIDARTFGPVIVSVSLNAPTVMNLSRDGQVVPIYLPQRSALVMQGDARHLWKHEINNKKILDLPSGKWTKPIDYRRISLTYRTVTGSDG